MSRVRLTTSARIDLADGWSFYEDRESGAGDYFRSRVHEALRTLEAIHGIHPKRFGHFHMLVPRFPYAIFYREHPDETEVIAVVDMRRDPKGIRRQLRQR